MGESWYRKCMPRVAEVKEILPDMAKSLKAIAGVKSIRIFGSLVEHFDDPNFRVKDIDVIACTPFHSGDLLAINKDMLSYKTDYLEEEGYDPEAVQFSRDFTRYAQYPIDHWVYSSDKKLLHWGPFVTRKDDAAEVKGEAEAFATQKTGFNLSKLAKANDENRRVWHTSFREYLNRQFDSMPTGWFRSEEKDTKSIIAQSVML